MGRSVHYEIKRLQWFQLGVTSVSDNKNSTVDSHLTTQLLAVIIEYEPSLWVFNMSVLNLELNSSKKNTLRYTE